MKATAVVAHANGSSPTYVCEHCGDSHKISYAMETGKKHFCKRSCWEAWRENQPPRYPAGALHESPRPDVR